MEAHVTKSSYSLSAIAEVTQRNKKMHCIRSLFKYPRLYKGHTSDEVTRGQHEHVASLFRITV